MTDAEKRDFSALPQDEKNRMVTRMVVETRGEYTCHDIVWTDGQVYTAFSLAQESQQPSEKPANEEH